MGAALAAMREPLAAHQVTVSSLSQLPLVECDGVLIERVLCNLLENAASTRRPAAPSSWARPCRTRNCASRFCDNGPAAGAERRIFQKFTRGERESATPGAWAWRCEAIVTAHHGRIWVEHAPGRPSGAQFVFTLPLGEPPAIQPETP